MNLYIYIALLGIASSNVFGYAKTSKVQSQRIDPVSQATQLFDSFQRDKALYFLRKTLEQKNLTREQRTGLEKLYRFIQVQFYETKNFQLYQNARASSLAGRPDACLKLIEGISKQDNSNVEVQLQKLDCLLVQKKLEDLGPLVTELRLNVMPAGYLPDPSQDIFDQANIDERFLVAMAQIQFVKGNFEEALIELAKVVKPRLELFVILRAQALKGLSKPSDAIDLLKRYTEQQTQAVEAWFELAKLYQPDPLKRDLALKAFQQFVQRVSGLPRDQKQSIRIEEKITESKRQIAELTQVRQS